MAVRTRGVIPYGKPRSCVRTREPLVSETTGGKWKTPATRAACQGWGGGGGGGGGVHRRPSVVHPHGSQFNCGPNIAAHFLIAVPVHGDPPKRRSLACGLRVHAVNSSSPAPPKTLRDLANRRYPPGGDGKPAATGSALRGFADVLRAVRLRRRADEVARIGVG